MRTKVVGAGSVAIALIMASSPARLAATIAQNVWIPIGLTAEYVQVIAADPQGPTTLYAGTSDDGLYKTSNGGQSWQAVNPAQTGLSISTLAISPSIPTTIYLAVRPDSHGKRGGLFKSTDGGNTWHAISIDVPTRASRAISEMVNTLAINPQTPTTLYVGTFEGVFRSTDGGGSWHATSIGLGSDDIDALIIDPRNPTTLYAITALSGVFKSSDGGESWRETNEGLFAPTVRPSFDITGLVIDPKTPATVYASTSGRGVFKSTDGGGSWHPVNTGLTDLRVNVLAIDPMTPTTVYAGTWHGVFESTDGGANWLAINSGLTDLSVSALAIDLSTPTTLYAGTWGGGVFISASVSGTQVQPSPQVTGSPSDIGSVTDLSVGEDGSVWLAIAVRGDLPAYAGSRQTVLYTRSSPQSQWLKLLEVSSHGAITRLWHFGSGRVTAWVPDGSDKQASGLIMRTTDQGVRWDSSSTPGGAYWAQGAGAQDISFPTQSQGWVLVSTGAMMSREGCELHHTIDGGDHWSKVAECRFDQSSSTSGLESEYKTGITFRNSTHGWIGTDSGAVGAMPYLYMSRDGGVTWTRQPLTPQAGKSDGQTGRVLPPKFFSGQAGVAVALLQSAVVYRTSDGGVTWDDPRMLPVGQGPNGLTWDFLSPTIWAVGSSQTLWFSTNTGQSWSRHSVPLPPTYKISKIAVAGPTRMLLVGSTVPPGGRRDMTGIPIPVADYVLETSDAGLHWTRIALP